MLIFLLLKFFWYAVVLSFAVADAFRSIPDATELIKINQINFLVILIKFDWNYFTKN